MKKQFKTTGLSLLELREKYGLGKAGFYDNEWWLDEDFAKEKPKVGTYTTELYPKWNDLTYQEQLDKMGDELEFLHPAVLTEAILSYYKKTGKRLMENWYSRTSSVTSGGVRVFVGYFDSIGLYVSYWSDDSRSYGIGLAASRKFKSLKAGNLDTLENRVRTLELFQKKVEKIIKL